MFKYTLIILMLFLNHFSYAMNITGSYTCNWFDVSTGQNIKGTVTLTKTGDTYAMKSIFSDHSSYRGTGIYNEKANTFALAFYNPDNKSDIGLSTTQFNQSKMTTWVWTNMNSNKIEHTICAKQ